jgi:lipoate-protein ligase A
MSVQVVPYDLPDAFLFSGTEDDILIWKPENTVIVLGQSNTPALSLIEENVYADGVPVTKRPTGGEAVVLTHRMGAITVARNFQGMTSSKVFFSEVNHVIMDILSDMGVKELGSKGISDITLGNRKILGSSMHRREGRLVYHAVLNLGEGTQVFERYLRHPRREPDYRQGRLHGEFVTSLKEEGYNLDFHELATRLDACFNADSSSFNYPMVYNN